VRDAGETPPEAVPGARGLPYLSAVWETLRLQRMEGWRRYYEVRRRRHRSPVFRVAAFGRAVAVTDATGFRVFSDWDGRLEKEYGFGPAVAPPRPLVGPTTPGIFARGFGHSDPKALHLALLKLRAGRLEAALDAAIDAAFERWAAQGRVALTDGIGILVEDFLHAWLIGAEPERAVLHPLYPELFANPLWRLTRHFPGSRFNRLKAVRERQVAALRAAPGFAEIMALPEAEHLGGEAAVAGQVAFLMGVNCWLGLQNLFRSLVGELAANPEEAAALRAEVEAATAAAGGRPGLSAVAALPRLDRFLKETLRLHPPVFFVYGTATRDFALEARDRRYLVERGERVVGVIPAVQRDPERYDRPDAFEPARFEDPAAEAGLVWPHGFMDDPADDVDAHVCPGRDVALTIAKRFCARLVAETDWALKAPPVWSEGAFELNVAAPEGDLRTTRFALRGAGD
jgi:cytochrome P450